jgi:NADH dehydrogenase (ubiquinone) 1 alpha subcomplex subunit 4
MTKKLIDLGSLVHQLKRNYSLVPLVCLGFFGVSIGIFTITRTLMKSPDVSIDRKGNPRPYEKMIDSEGKPQKYRFFSKKLEYSSTVDSERPKLEKDLHSNKQQTS